MKIAVLASGGVDSSVALHLLREQGHDLTAFYLKIWLEEELSFLGECPWEEDLFYVEKLCKKLDIPLQVVSMQEAYLSLVVSYTIDSVKSGRTPNPDILCNQRIKFGAFFNKIDKNFDRVATGHYAQIERLDGVSRLTRANDPVKDQTYFLSSLDQSQLGRVMFPIGHLTKNEVRELAEKYDVPAKDRKDSQGICFLGKIKFKEFLWHHLGVKYGDIVEFESGKKLGRHNGFWYHTIGQRRGLGLSGGPWYVVSKDTDQNIVYVSSKYFDQDKARNSFFVSHCHWISGKRPEKNDLLVKIRHGKDFYKAAVEFQGQGAFVKLDDHDQGIAPGQFAVFYDQERCLGCGSIEQGAI